MAANQATGRCADEGPPGLDKRRAKEAKQNHHQPAEPAGPKRGHGEEAARPDKSEHNK